jgi:hypothetical protein
MKTLLSIFFISMLTMAAVSLDTYQLDLADWFTAVMVAAMFGIALNDTQRSSRFFRRLR